MGYPMTYPRVINRNSLMGDYSGTGIHEQTSSHALIAGDLRRLEHDVRDELHLKRFAERAGITDHQAWIVLTEFFTDFGLVQTPWLAKPCWPDKRY